MTSNRQRRPLCNHQPQVANGQVIWKTQEADGQVRPKGMAWCNPAPEGKLDLLRLMAAGPALTGSLLRIPFGAMVDRTGLGSFAPGLFTLLLPSMVVWPGFSISYVP